MKMTGVVPATRRLMRCVVWALRSSCVGRGSVMTLPPQWGHPAVCLGRPRYEDHREQLGSLVLVGLFWPWSGSVVGATLGTERTSAPILSSFSFLYFVMLTSAMSCSVVWKMVFLSFLVAESSMRQAAVKRSGTRSRSPNCFLWVAVASFASGPRHDKNSQSLYSFMAGFLSRRW